MAPKFFNGPYSPGLVGFAKSIASMPAKYKATFDKISETSTAAITDKASLHIWETDSDIDSLLHLTQVIVKVRALTNYVPNASGMGKTVPAGMVILVEGSDKRDNFGRVCELVQYQSKEKGKPHLDKTVVAFGTIAVVKGINNLNGPDNNGDYPGRRQRDADSAVRRLNITLERIFKKCAYAEEKLVWHNGPVVHFLNHWINNTTSDLRSSLTAVTINSTLDITGNSIDVSTAGRVNEHSCIQRLELYCNRLKIFAVFLDTSSQLIAKDRLAMYMYYYAYYIHLFLTPSLLRPHIHLAQDALIKFAFRLRSACDKSYTTEATHTVKSHLPADKAKAWADTCISPFYYTKAGCRSAAKDEEVVKASRLADTPLQPFTPGPPRAFSRLTIGPTASLLSEHYICAPISLSWDEHPIQIRASSDSAFRLWLPKPDQDESKVAQRIQGIMMGVLEIVLREKGMPVINAKGEEAEMWHAVVKACMWALEGTKGKLPRGVEEKVEFVRKGFAGSWSFNFWGPQL